MFQDNKTMKYNEQYKFSEIEDNNEEDTGVYQKFL